MKDIQLMIEDCGLKIETPANDDDSSALNHQSSIANPQSKSPFTQAHTLITQALTLLEATDQTLDVIMEAAERLITVRIALSIWSERPQPTLSAAEHRAIAGDLAVLKERLSGDRCAPMRALISQAERIVATEAQQPAGVDAAREGVRG